MHDFMVFSIDRDSLYAGIKIVTFGFDKIESFLLYEKNKRDL